MLLERLAHVLLKWWWLVVASVLAASIPTFVGTRALPLTYTSKTTLMVGQILQSSNPNAAEFSTGQVLAQSYADLAKREPVLRATLDTLGLKWDPATLNSMVGSRPIPGTSLLEISVTDTDPERARVLVDEIANQLILQSPAGTDPQKEAERQFVLKQIQELRTSIKASQQEVRDLDDVIAKASSARQIQDARSQQTAIQTQLSGWQATYAQLASTLQQGAPNSLSVVEPAMTPQPTRPRTLLNVAMAAAIGLALAVGAALLLELIDDSLKTSDDVRRVLNLTSWGNIPRIEGHDRFDRLVMIQSPRSPAAEAFRMLRTNLQSSVRARPLRTLLLTSPGPEEGKSLIAANLAVTLAQSGKQVILVDADLRRSTQHQVFELDNQAGLSTFLTDDRVSLDDVLQTVPAENLRVLTSGPLPEAPNELLGSERMSELIEHLQQCADVVIFDSSPIMVVGDAAILAPQMDDTLLVIDSGKTRPAAARRSKEALELAKAHLVGAVLNRLSARVRGYYDYYAEDGQRHGRAQQPALNARQATPGTARTVPSLAPAKLSVARSPIAPLKQIDRPAPRPSPEPHRIPRPSLERKPLPLAKETRPEMITPAVRQAVPATTGGYPRLGAPSSTARMPGARPPAVSPRARLTGSQIGRMARLTGSHIGRRVRQNSLSLALGAGAGVVLIVVFASALLMRQTAKGQTAPTQAVVAVQATANAPIPANSTTPTATLAANETDVAQRQTDEAQARSAAATGTAALGATATHVALNASAAQQAVGFLNCDTMDFEILESPVDTTSVTSSESNVEFTWRVRNKASLPYCKWGQEGQETRLVRAIEVSGRLGTSVPVKLKWIDGDEYALSLTARLGIGQYGLSWRLLLPKTNLPGGPELRATAVVLAPTPTSAPTLVPSPRPVPTSTPCPTIVYECKCKEKCSGRNCTTECQQCTRQECGK
jgi:succinoglycan biosynthesis transport protein ExoP